MTPEKSHRNWAESDDGRTIESLTLCSSGGNTARRSKSGGKKISGKIMRRTKRLACHNNYLNIWVCSREGSCAAAPNRYGLTQGSPTRTLKNSRQKKHSNSSDHFARDLLALTLETCGPAIENAPAHTARKASLQCRDAPHTFRSWRHSNSNSDLACLAQSVMLTADHPQGTQSTVRRGPSYCSPP